MSVTLAGQRLEDNLQRSHGRRLMKYVFVSGQERGRLSGRDE